jgi:hypothetical protein
VYLFFASFERIVVVSAAPTLKYDRRSDDMTTHVGGMVKITVSIDGEPTPTVQWMKVSIKQKYVLF